MGLTLRYSRQISAGTRLTIPVNLRTLVTETLTVMVMWTEVTLPFSKQISAEAHSIIPVHRAPKNAVTSNKKL